MKLAQALLLASTVSATEAVKDNTARKEAFMKKVKSKMGDGLFRKAMCADGEKPGCKDGSEPDCGRDIEVTWNKELVGNCVLSAKKDEALNSKVIEGVALLADCQAKCRKDCGAVSHSATTKVCTLFTEEGSGLEGNAGEGIKCLSKVLPDVNPFKEDPKCTCGEPDANGVVEEPACSDGGQPTQAAEAFFPGCDKEADDEEADEEPQCQDGAPLLQMQDKLRKGRVDKKVAALKKKKAAGGDKPAAKEDAKAGDKPAAKEDAKAGAKPAKEDAKAGEKEVPKEMTEEMKAKMKEIFKGKMDARDKKKREGMEKMLNASCPDGKPPACTDGTNLMEDPEDLKLKAMDESKMKTMLKEKVDGMDKADKDGRKMGAKEMLKKLGKSKEDFKKDIDGMSKDQMRGMIEDFSEKMGKSKKDMDGEFKGMKKKFAEKPKCKDETTPKCSDKSDPLNKEEAAMKLIAEQMCPDDKLPPQCADKSDAKITKEDKETMDMPKPKCTDGNFPVCTGGKAAKDKIDALLALMCPDNKPPACPSGGKLLEKEDEEGGRHPKCDNDQKPACTDGTEPELPEILQGMMKMKKMKDMKSDNIDKAKFFCKDGKQPTCKAGAKLAWRMGGEQKQKKKFDPKKGGCRDMQKPMCKDADGVETKPTCLKGEDAKKKCTDKQPRLCAGGKEPLCGDGSKQMRPKPPANKAVKLVCKEGEAKCSSGEASCSDGTKVEAVQCNAPWLCPDGEREKCSDGSFPRMVAKKDKKKQGWNKPVRRPKISRDDFKNEELSEELKDKTMTAMDSILGHLETATKENNKTRHNMRTKIMSNLGIPEKEDAEEELDFE